MYKVFINDKEIIFYKPDATEKFYSPKQAAKLIEELISKINRSGKGLKKNQRIPTHQPYSAFQLFVKSFPKISAAGGVVGKSKSCDPLLMIQRLGKWDLPKGKVDPGENLPTAAVREVVEECGIGKLKIIRKLHPTFHMYIMKKQWVIKKTVWYQMQTGYNGVLIPQSEEGITKVKWIQTKELKKYLPLSYPAIAELIKKEILSS